MIDAKYPQALAALDAKEAAPDGPVAAPGGPTGAPDGPLGAPGGPTGGAGDAPGGMPVVVHEILWEITFEDGHKEQCSGEGIAGALAKFTNEQIESMRHFKYLGSVNVGFRRAS